MDVRKWCCGLWLFLFLFAGGAVPASATGDLHIVAPAGVKVWLNNHFQGTTGATGLIIENITGGDYILRAEKDGDTVVERFFLEDGRAIEVVLDFSPPAMRVDDLNRRVTAISRSGNGCELVLRSIPLHAQVFLDGQDLGRTDKRVRNLEPGEHTITFVLGSRTLEKTYTLAAKESRTIKADFREEQLDSGLKDSASLPAELLIQSASSRQPTLFPHAKHQEFLECGDCHHGRDAEGRQVPYAEGMKITRCISCHSSKEMKNRKLNSLKLAGHALCKGCHRKMVKQGFAPPIVRCVGCHVRPEKREKAGRE